MVNRARALRALPTFNGAEKGRDGDASVIATGLSRSIPVITADRPVYHAMRFLGGMARLLE